MCPARTHPPRSTAPSAAALAFVRRLAARTSKPSRDGWRGETEVLKIPAVPRKGEAKVPAQPTASTSSTLPKESGKVG